MSKQRNRDISLYDSYYNQCSYNNFYNCTKPSKVKYTKPCKKPSRCTPPNQVIDLCNIRELRKNRCYQDPCYLKCSKYNKCCQCIQCNNKYNACYQKCQNKCREQSKYNTYNTCHCDRCYKNNNCNKNNTCHCDRCYNTCNNNTVAQPLSQCLFATTGVIYPLINNTVHPCQF